MFLEGIGRALSGGGNLAGAALVAASAALFGLYTVLGKRFMRGLGLDSAAMTALTFIIGAAMLAPIMLAIGTPFALRDLSILPLMAWMSLPVTGLAYALYFKGLSMMDAGAGSILYFAKPPLAALLAFILLGERPGPWLALSFALIAAGIALGSLSGARRPRRVA